MRRRAELPLTRALALTVGLCLGLSGVARAACEQPARMGDLLRPLSDAQSAFATMNGPAFAEADRQAREALGCLSEPITAAGAAAWHRHAGLGAWLVDDVDTARQDFRSALQIQPRWTLPEDVAPPNNPLSRLYEEAGTLGPGHADPVWVEGAQVLVDGAVVELLPRERPVVLQILSEDGRVLETVWLRPGEEPPPQVRQGERPAVPIERLAAKESFAGPRLAVGAGVAGLAAGGLYTWSAVSHARYVTPGLAPDSELDDLVRANHLAVYGAGGLTALALGLGVGAVVAW